MELRKWSRIFIIYGWSKTWIAEFTRSSASSLFLFLLNILVFKRKTREEIPAIQFPITRGNHEAEYIYFVAFLVSLVAS